MKNFSGKVPAVCCMPSKKPALFVPPPYLAYTKALRIIKNAEAALGFPLTTRCVGGKSGGGSTLTPQGKEWLTKYETYRDACVHANRKLYLEIFSNKR